jgi:mono/diheme cytochrome c family protein
MKRANEVTTVVLLVGLVLILGSASAQNKSQGDHAQFPSTYIPSGEVMYEQYCAGCHGGDGKGHGPAAGTFRTRPPDLTTLANRHGGKFPYAYVYDVLFWGPLASHGSASMPVWGPVFLSLDKRSETAVQKRIANLSAYLVSLQAAQEPRDGSTP